MDPFLNLTPERRRLACEAAGRSTGFQAASIEKDVWVCWILRQVLALPEEGPRVTFKGGTSLSKCWQLIDRFSEDLDLVLDRELLGFGGTNDPAVAPSRKKQLSSLENLREACGKRVRGSLKSGLEASLRAALRKEAGWDLREDPQDPDGQTLLFKYPLSVPAGDYVQAMVRLEFGARSDTEPLEHPRMRPYLADAFPDIFESPDFSIPTVSPLRTFWEKAMLLHEEIHRAARSVKRRLARHYYDLWCLIRRGVAERAAADRALRERVARHRAVFFRIGGVDYDALLAGRLDLRLPSERLSEWRADFAAMRNEMFAGSVPTFDEIHEAVAEFGRTMKSPSHE